MVSQPPTNHTAVITALCVILSRLPVLGMDMEVTYVIALVGLLLILGGMVNAVTSMSYHLAELRLHLWQREGVEMLNKGTFAVMHNTEDTDK